MFPVKRALMMACAVAVAAAFGPMTAAAATPAASAALSTCYGSDWGLQVLAPTPYEVVTTDLPLHVQSVNYRLDARYAGTPDLPDIGHYHEYLDNYIPGVGNQPMPGVGAGLIDLAPTTDPTHDTISMTAVSPGLHWLTLTPACNDHTPDWGAVVNVPFYYKGSSIPEPAYTGLVGLPTVSVASPATGTVLSGTSFDMTVNVQNFLLCGPCYAKALESNVGHWHMFAVPTTGPSVIAMPGDVMPGVFSGMPAMFSLMQPHMISMFPAALTQTAYLVGLATSPGWYTFYAVLVDNHHMPFTVPVTMNGMTVGMMLQPGTAAMANYYVSPLS
jgi:hypothetical protein